MRLFFTGASSFLASQPSPRLSLGGFISNSPVPNDVLNGIFGSISDRQGNNGLKETFGFALRNETGGTITTGTLWYVNNSTSPISNLRMAVVAVGTDSCGDIFIEQIQSSLASPLNAVFTDNNGQANAISLPSIDDNAYLGIWIERSINPVQFKQAFECENLYNTHVADPLPQIVSITTVADLSNSLNGAYWFLNTPLEQFYIWYDTGTGVNPNIAGREGIRVSIATDDVANDVASKTSSQLNAILQPRGVVTSTVQTNIITITNSLNGPSPAPTPENSNFLTSITQTGVVNTLEQIEDLDLFIDY